MSCRLGFAAWHWQLHLTRSEGAVRVKFVCEPASKTPNNKLANSGTDND